MDLIAKYHDIIFFILVIGLICAGNLWIHYEKKAMKLAKELDEKNLHIKNLEVLKDRLSDDLSSCINERNVLNEEVKNLKQLDMFRIKEPQPIILTDSLPVFRVYKKVLDDRNREGLIITKLRDLIIAEALEPIRDQISERMIISPDRDHLIVDFDFTFNFIRNNNV